MESRHGGSSRQTHRRPIALALPRFSLGEQPGALLSPTTPVVEPASPVESAHAHTHAPAPAPQLTPTPVPAPHPAVVQPHAPSPANGHAHDHAASHAHADSHAHSHDHSTSHAHTHAHAHSHGPGGCEGSHGLFDAHTHDWSHLAMAPRSRRFLKLALLVQFAFLILEVVGGVITNSLALLGDAAHMLADVGALGLALLAATLATRPISRRRTWGMPRVEMLAAFINAVTLVASCGWIAYEAVMRLREPEHIHSHGLITIAIAGLLANLAGAWLLAQADRDNLNIRAAMAHLLIDAASSVGVIIAGIAIALGGPVIVDTIASLLIAILAVKGTWPVLRAALDSLLDAAPAGIDAASVVRVLRTAPGVTEVHDVHVWEPGPRRIAVTAHVLVRDGCDIGAAILELRGMLEQQLGADHVTLQVAHDRRSQRLAVERVLPRDAAIRRAIRIAAAQRPGVGEQRVAGLVLLHASHVPEHGTASPVRLAAAALRDLARGHEAAIAAPQGHAHAHGH